MLTNYNQDQFGVIHQIDKQPLVYSNSYVDSVYQTDNMKILTRQMAYLRLGFITGVVSKPTNQLSLLDIGFGNGAFLDVAKTAFKTVAGNDIFDNPTWNYDYAETNIVKWYFWRFFAIPVDINVTLMEEAYPTENMTPKEYCQDVRNKMTYEITGNPLIFKNLDNKINLENNKILMKRIFIIFILFIYYFT